MKVPTLHFRYSHIYDRMLYAFAAGHAPANPLYFKSRAQECVPIAERLTKNMNPVLAPHLKNLIQTLGIGFPETVIPVYVLSFWHKHFAVTGFSDPMTIVLRRWKDKELVPLTSDDLKFLLLHNLAHSIQHPLFHTNYPVHLEHQGLKDPVARNHALTFALLKSVLKKHEYEEFVSRYSEGPYKEAAEFVKKEGEKKMIKEAKGFLKKKRGKFGLGKPKKSPKDPTSLHGSPGHFH